MVDLSIVMLVYQRVTLQKMEVSSSILPSKLQRCAIFSAMCQGLEGLFTLVGQVGEYLPWWSECWLTCNGLLFLMNTYIYIYMYIFIFIYYIYLLYYNILYTVHHILTVSKSFDIFCWMMFGYNLPPVLVAYYPDDSQESQRLKQNWKPSLKNGKVFQKGALRFVGKKTPLILANFMVFIPWVSWGFPPHQP